MDGVDGSVILGLLMGTTVVLTVDNIQEVEDAIKAAGKLSF